MQESCWILMVDNIIMKERGSYLTIIIIFNVKYVVKIYYRIRSDKLSSNVIKDQDRQRVNEIVAQQYAHHLAVKSGAFYVPKIMVWHIVKNGNLINFIKDVLDKYGNNIQFSKFIETMEDNTNCWSIFILMEKSTGIPLDEVKPEILQKSFFPKILHLC